MKTTTCKSLGGLCDKELSAETWEEIIKKMVAHVMKNHPEAAEEIKKMYEEKQGNT